MELAPGLKLGPYEILSPIGAGGMGEVFKARDTRLDRIVAIKVMPKYIAAREELRARFEREARTVSSLNHPNICVLHDIGKQDGIDFMVLEYLEGETLAARIAKGPLPLGQALKYAMQIADALDRSHRKGVVHRDVKPANIMITREGVKVLDFGLAKSAVGKARVDDATMTIALTEEGAVVGTPQYTAPELYTGVEADVHADIFGFGCVLYEMITGKRAFDGKTRVSVVASVIGAEPQSMSSLVAVTPSSLERLVQGCLVKDPAERYQSLWDVLIDLRGIGESGAAASTAPSSSLFGKIGWIAAAAIAAAVGLACIAVTWWLKPVPPVSPHVITRFSYPLPEGQNFTRPGRHDIALSPDGTKLVYLANQQLYLRAMDQLEAQPIRGTNEDPAEPVFSPDGQWLAYFASSGSTGGGTVLKKIAVAGGAPVTLAVLPALPSGATWSNGTIAFGMNAEKSWGILAVTDAGGAPWTLVAADPKKERLAQPRILADGKHLLFVSLPLAGIGNGGQIVVQTLDGKDRRILVDGGTDPRVLAAGQLVYFHDNTLLAVPFDAGRLAITGGPVPLLEGVTSSLYTGQFAVSSEGTLAFRPGGSQTVASGTLVWVDREGHEQPIPAAQREYVYPRLSPDGTRIAVACDDEEHDIWVWHLARQTLTRVTFGAAWEEHPAWTADGKYILFSTGPARPGNSNRADLARKAADGTGQVESLTEGLKGGYPLSFSPDGNSLLIRNFDTSTLGSLLVLPLNPKGPPHPLIADPKLNNGYDAEISPDGRWVAYDSGESGRREVYVRPFPDVDKGRWQISSGGGTDPLWSRSGRELFFVSGGNRMTVAPVPAGSAFTFGKPEPLFDISAYRAVNSTTMVSRPFDISPDGKRFLMVRPVGATGATGANKQSITVISHWADDVKARMPAK